MSHACLPLVLLLAFGASAPVSDAGTHQQDGQAWSVWILGRDAFATSDEWYPYGVFRSRAAALRDLRENAKRNRITITFSLSPIGRTEFLFPPAEAMRPGGIQ